MSQNNEGPSWHKYVAVSTAIIAVLAAVASFQASSNSSLMLDEKNNSILFQNKANKEWNNYLASNVAQEKKSFQQKSVDLESQSDAATKRFQVYFAKNSKFVLAGTFLEIAIAICAMSTLVRQKAFWLFSLGIAGVRIYFLAQALI